MSPRRDFYYFELVNLSANSTCLFIRREEYELGRMGHTRLCSFPKEKVNFRANTGNISTPKRRNRYDKT